MDAVKNNRGRVIQSAAITIQDTKPGTIRKMTSYPYVVQTQNSIDTKTADVGIEVKLTPKILNDAQKSQDLNLSVDITVSQVVGAAAGTSYPITSSDVIGTTINIKSGDTAAIGGIVQNNLSKSYMDGSDDPNVIVSLSRSKSFTKGKSQFIVFITPEILNTASEGSDAVKEKFRVK
jgi:pilus assembly protein CpaC